MSNKNFKSRFRDELEIINSNLVFTDLRVKNPNQKSMIKWIGDKDFKRSVFFTGVLTDSLGLGFYEDKLTGKIKFFTKDYLYRKISKVNKHFLNELHRTVFKKSRIKITRLVVIETGRKLKNSEETTRNHVHMIIEVPEHLSVSKFTDVLEESWLRTKSGISSDIRKVDNINGLVDYLMKDISHNSLDQVDITNCKFRNRT